MPETLLDTGADAFGFNATSAAPVSRGSLFSSPKAVGTQYQAQLEAEAVAKEKKDKTNYWDGFKKAYQQNTGWVFESNSLANDMIDPQYKHDLSKHKKMLEDAGAQKEHYDYFNQPIYSEKHAQLLIDRYKESRANDQYMADMGLAGSLAVNLAAGVLDPVGLAAGVVTGGAAYAYKAYKVGKMVEAGMATAKAVEEVNKLSKTAMAVRGAVAGAAENMAVEGILSTKKPTWETDDLLWAGAFGAGFGGAGAFIGASLKAGSREHINNPTLGEENAAIHRIGDGVEIGSVRDDVRNGEYEVSPEVERIINDPNQTDPIGEVGKKAAEAEARIKQIEEEISVKEAELKATRDLTKTQDTTLVSRENQLKSTNTDTEHDFTHLLPDKVHQQINAAPPGTVISDLRAASGATPEQKAAHVTIRKSIEDFANKLMSEFLPDNKMYLTTKAASIPAKSVKSSLGVTMSLSPDTFQITINPKHMKDKQAYSTLAHEIGHQVLNHNFFRAPALVRHAIYDEYQSYLTAVKGMKSGDEVKHSRFTPDHAERVTLVDNQNPADKLASMYRDKNYIFSFDEYMAERFAKYVQQRDDLTLPQAVKEYFEGLMEKLKSLFGKVEGHLKTGTTVEKFFEDIRAGNYKDAPKVTDAALKKETAKVEKDIAKLREELGIQQENQAAYNSFLRSDTAAAMLRDAPETVMGNVRFDIAGQLLSSKNPIVRNIGSLLVNDPVGLKNGATQRMTAEEGQKILQRQMEVAYYRDFTPLFEQWKSKQSLPVGEIMGARAKFSEEVGLTYNGLHPNPSPEAKMMAQAYSKLMLEYNGHINDVGKMEGKALGGLRSEPLPDDPQYFTRMHDLEKWHTFIAKHGEDNAALFYKNSMMKANPWLNDALATRISKGYVRKILKRDLEEFSSFERAFSGEDLDELRKVLDDMGGLSKDEIDTVVFELRARTGKTEGDAPANSRMKRRAMLDTSHVENFNGEQVDISHFINMNIEEVFSNYNRQMSGAISMARVGIRTKGDFDRLILQIADSSRSIDGYAGSYAMKSEIASLDFAYKRIMGVPTNPDTALTRFSGMLQKYNFVRLMNQMGLAQFQELSNILGQMGLKTALKSFPSLDTFIRDVKTGKINDQVMDELEVVLGHGSDILRGHNISERWMDESGGFSNPASNKVLNSIDTALNKGVNATMHLSGFRHVNVLLQRWVSKALAQKFTDAAFGNADKVIKSEFRQMMGMDDAMYKRVLDQLKKHSKTEQGAIFGRNIKALNLNQWDDAQASAAFTTGIFRWSRRMIQENDIGSMHRFMGTTAGQMIFQFRSFILNAYSKSMLWGLHTRNTEMAMSLMWGTLMGSAVYAGRLYVNSMGREDREEYLDKHLSLGNVVANGISRTAQASILPGLIDSTVSPLFGGQIFSESRTTGLAAGTGPFTDALGNPSLDLMNKLGNIPKTIGTDIVGDHDQNAAAIRRSLGMLPWQNAMGVQQVLNVLAEGIAD